MTLVTALVVTGWILRRSFGSGNYLVRDFVAVPDPGPPSGLPRTAAALRAWPLDAVSWLLSPVVGSGLQQVFLLAGVLVLAGVGTGLVVSRWGSAAAVAACVLAVWNPYVTERLLLGQPPTLLGYAMVPWILLASRAGGSRGRRILLLSLAVAPAALTPWGGAMAVLVALLGSLSVRGRPAGEDVTATTVALAWSLPWLVPAALAGGVPADPEGAMAFSLADDTGLGTWVSALTGGGAWGVGAVPRSRGDVVAQVASIALVLLALGGALVVGRLRGWSRGVLAVVLLAGPATLLALLSGPLLVLAEAAQSVPGLALVRDQHRLLAPAVLTGAVLVGLLVGKVSRDAGRFAGGTLAAVALALAVASVPDLPRTVGAAYRPVEYPAQWAEVVEVINDAPGRPVVLSLPWQPLRQTAWAPWTPFLDPLPRAVDADVLVDTTLTVRRDERDVDVDDSPGGEDQWRSGTITAESLNKWEVQFVVEWLDTPGALPASQDGWVEILVTPDFRVWSVLSAR